MEKATIMLLDTNTTLSSALSYGKEDKTEQWVHEYLLGIGDNKAFSDGLKKHTDRRFLRPTRMPLNLFTRICGPEDGIKFQVDRDAFEEYIKNMIQSMNDGWSAPPLIINYSDGQFELNDGNHRFESLTRLGVKEHYVIIWTITNEDYNEFTKKYSSYIESR